MADRVMATRSFGRARRRSAAYVTAALIGLAPTISGQAISARESTLGDVLAALDSAARIGHVEVADPAARRTFDSVRVALTLHRLTSLTVTDVANAVIPEAHHVPAVTAAVIGRFKTDSRTVAFSDAVFALIAFGNVQVVNAVRATGMSREAIDALLRPHDDLVRAMRRAAHDRNQRLLRNFERKYGPQSPQLNYVEVALNYAAQFIPLLGTTERSGPSPLEIVASYQTTGVRMGVTKENPPKLVSGVRGGFRFYFFGDGWADSGMVKRYIRPAHMSLGIYTMGPSDQTLSRAWGRGYRAGPFLGWGDLYIGALIDPDHRIVAGVSKQLIPRLF